MLAPDDFDTDPYGHVTNQAGHAALIGMPLGVAFLALGLPLWAAPLAVALSYGLIWEWDFQRLVWGRSFDWRDSLMDTACVMAGASMVSGFLYNLLSGAICLFAWAVVVIWGGIRRWQP